MKKAIALTCVALALCFAVGMLYGAEGEKGKKEGKTGMPEGPQAMGKVKAVDTEAKTLTVTVKKEEATNDVVFTVNDDTKIFVGREATTLAAVKVGANCMVAYKTTDAGNVALVVRIVGERGGKEGKKEGGKREGGNK